MMTRDEHLEGCKVRAREYLDRGDIMNGITSMLSDLSKHKDTADLAKGGFAQVGMHTIMVGNLDLARRFVDGFR